MMLKMGEIITCADMTAATLLSFIGETDTIKSSQLDGNFPSTSAIGVVSDKPLQESRCSVRFDAFRASRPRGHEKAGDDASRRCCRVLRLPSAQTFLSTRRHEATAFFSIPAATTWPKAASSGTVLVISRLLASLASRILS